jgi:hypothetical protein
MGTLNIGRVMAGGLLAGLIINVSEFILNGVVLAADMEAAMRALNRPPMDTSMIVWFALVGFALGITSVWLYAAIRPRFGPGVATATYAALAVWFLAYLYPSVFVAVAHIFPRRLVAIGTVWGLPEIVIATIAGAWAYTEA